MTSDVETTSTTETRCNEATVETGLSRTEERPLVTFALFAYNQERFIREAIKGAFAQTYEPLEIILSDDCSTDGTFEIMQEMATSYRGPHRVILNQNIANLGVIDHVITVAQLSHGKLMIVAAGDDISYPNRVEQLTFAWKDTHAMGLYSDYDEITVDGNFIRRGVRPKPLERIQTLFRNCRMPQRYDGYVRHIPGFSAAYSTNFLRAIPLSNKKIHNEDALTTYLINLMGGKITYVEEVLVRYRLNPNSISAFGNRELSLKSLRDEERKFANFAASTSIFLPYFCELVALTKSPDSNTIIRELKKLERMAKLASNFWSASVFQRLVWVVGARNFSEFKFLTTRLFGMQAFVLLKYVYMRLRQSEIRHSKTASSQMVAAFMSSRLSSLIRGLAGRPRS
jgi:glycosyltransferase involved in cell wall biosynthesis